jgi:LysR family glycine cleavage system transcriptional activator
MPSAPHHRPHPDSRNVTASARCLADLDPFRRWLNCLLDLVLAKDHLPHMVGTTHLKSLQALDMAIREGSLRLAAARLGITPAAVGQRIRAVEDFLGTTLLLRGRSGLIPSPQLDLVLADLRLAFDALERVTETLDFQRTSEIHIVADPDWAELWLLPRMAAFRREHPNILF